MIFENQPARHFEDYAHFFRTVALVIIIKASFPSTFLCVGFVQDWCVVKFWFEKFQNPNIGRFLKLIYDPFSALKRLYQHEN